ncbi:hypothetical protein Mapa_013900 [Marchantia paleacea]|nr:hypothetical protein Mapa_013900 [Marchantia paleacea]
MLSIKTAATLQQFKQTTVARINQTSACHVQIQLAESLKHKYTRSGAICKALLLFSYYFYIMESSIETCLCLNY